MKSQLFTLAQQFWLGLLFLVQIQKSLSLVYQISLKIKFKLGLLINKQTQKRFLSTKSHLFTLTPQFWGLLFPQCTFESPSHSENLFSRSRLLFLLCSTSKQLRCSTLIGYLQLMNSPRFYLFNKLIICLIIALQLNWQIVRFPTQGLNSHNHFNYIQIMCFHQSKLKRNN